MVRPVLRPYIGEAAEVVTKATTELTLPMVKTFKLGLCFNMNREMITSYCDNYIALFSFYFE